MSELKTEPGFPLSRISKRPWWLAALISGLGIGAGAVAALGLSSAAARGSEPRIAASGMFTGTAAEHQQAEEAAWRGRMEQKVDEALQRIAHIEGRLDRR